MSEDLHGRIRILCRPPEKPESKLVVTEALRMGVSVLTLLQKARDSELPEEETIFEDGKSLTNRELLDVGNRLDEMVEIERNVIEPSNQWLIHLDLLNEMKADLERLASDRKCESIEELMIDAALAFCLTEEFKRPGIDT